jgi:hypothetical protein
MRLWSAWQIAHLLALRDPHELSAIISTCRPSVFDGIKLMMFYRDHFPAHFHAEYGGEEAEISVDPIMILEGSLSRPIRAKVFEWAAIHQAELRAN